MTYKLNGKLKNLTEYYWSSVILSSFAFNGKLGTTGLPTCIDMRQNLKKTSFSNGNCFSHVNIHANVKKDDTVDTLMKRMRQDFKFKFSQKEPIGEYKAMSQVWVADSLSPGLVPILSLNSSFKADGPFKDMWLGIHSIDGGKGSIVA